MGERPLKVYIVGVGPGSPAYLTDRARGAIRSAEIVVGWELDLLPVRDMLAGKEVYVQDASNYVEVARAAARRARETGKSVAVARVGDPCVSSGLLGLLEVFSGFEVEVIPGISSVQLAAALAHINLDESVVVSFHDYGDPEAKKRFMVEAFHARRHLIVLASPDLTVEGAAKHLVYCGIDPETPAIACSNLTLEGESVERGTLRSISKRKHPWLSLLVVLNPQVPSNSEAYREWLEWRRRRRGG